MPGPFEKLARHAWEAAQRIGMHIAEIPPDQREEAFKRVEKHYQDVARELGIAREQIDEFVKNQMDVIRGIVQNIDVRGSPKGGRA